MMRKFLENSYFSLMQIKLIRNYAEVVLIPVH